VASDPVQLHKPHLSIKEVVAWSTLSAMLIGGVFFAEDRYANAQQTTSSRITQGLTLQNDAEARANENRLERLVRELAAVHARNQAGATYPGDADLIADLKEEIRISREYRIDLRKAAAAIK